MGHYNQHSFEMKDDAVDLGTIAVEVKRIGADAKKMQESLQGDINAVRELAEAAKSPSPELDAKFSEITASIEAKNTALEALTTKTEDRFNQMETALNRLPSGGTGDDDAALLAKHALDFEITQRTSKGGVTYRGRPTADEVDIEAYKSWDDAFGAYLRLDEKGMHSPEEMKALSVGRNPDGGYLVPTARSNRIIERIFETSPLRQLATVETIGSEALEIGLDLEEAESGWIGEEKKPGETNTPGVGAQRIVVHEQFAQPGATAKFLEDAAIDVEAWLERKVSDKFARDEATAFILGDGVAKPRGILSYNLNFTGEFGRAQTLAIKSGLAAGITADAIVTAPFTLKAQYMARGVWMMGRRGVQQIMMLKDNDGQYLWRPGLADGQPASLGGYRVQNAEDMPAVAANSLSYGFGDWREAYTVVDRLGITTIRDNLTAKPKVLFYSRKRVGGDVTDFDAYMVIQTAA